MDNPFLSNNAKKAFVVFAANILLILNCYIFYRFIIKQKILRIINLRPEEQIYSLIYFDILAYMLVCLAVLFILSLLVERKGHNFSNFNILNGHPIITFCLIFFISSCGIVFMPTIIAEKLLIFDPYYDFIPRPVFPQKRYWLPTFFTVLTFSIYFADLKIKSKVKHWWLFPFLLLPAPILWWSCINYWIPSKIWKAWRPVLAMLTCLVPVLVYFTSQPLRISQPIYMQEQESIQRLELAGDNPYDIRRIPNKFELFITQCSSLCRYERSPDSEWKMQQCLNLDFFWNITAYDFKRNLGYIQNGRNGKLYVVNLESLTVDRVLQIDGLHAPDRLPITFLDFDPKRDILIVADYSGRITTIDVNEFKIINHYKIDNAFVTQLSVDSEKGLVYYLTQFDLRVFDIETLSLKKIIHFKSMASGFANDNSNNRFFISFPKEMTVRLFDWSSCSCITTIQAPAGVRNILVDNSGNKLFLGAISGEIQIRDLKDFRLIKRARISPWIHWLEIIPELEELAISPGDNRPVIWKYNSNKDKLKLIDYFYYTATEIFHLFMSHFGKNHDETLCTP